MGPTGYTHAHKTRASEQPTRRQRPRPGARGAGGSRLWCHCREHLQHLWGRRDDWRARRGEGGDKRSSHLQWTGSRAFRFLTYQRGARSLGRLPIPSVSSGHSHAESPSDKLGHSAGFYCPLFFPRSDAVLLYRDCSGTAAPLTEIRELREFTQRLPTALLGVALREPGLRRSSVY